MRERKEGKRTEGQYDTHTQTDEAKFSWELDSVGIQPTQRWGERESQTEIEMKVKQEQGETEFGKYNWK